MWSKEDIDDWIDVLAQVLEEAYTDPELVRTAPHNQAIRSLGRDRPQRPGERGRRRGARYMRKRRQRDDAAPSRPRSRQAA